MKKRAEHELRRVLHPRTLVPKTSMAAVRAIWILAILWHEVGTFHWHLAACQWPDPESMPRNKEGSSSGSRHAVPAHVLLVADPQVRSPGNSSWRRWLRLTDVSLRKRWSFVRRVRPDVVVFLGDMLGDGRYLDDHEYQESFEYFKSIFSVDPNTEVYHVPGNRDVGLGPGSRRNTAHARRRYSKYIGPLNNKISIANHTLIMLDAPGVVDEDYRRSKSGQTFEDWQAKPDGAIDFINNFAGVGSDEPVVLFSHIPLFRPDTAGCGPLREKGSIRRGVGPGFQNMLMRDTTRYILRYVRPAIVFSGNDHDYCEYLHSIPLVSEGPEARIDYVREVTVKAITSNGNIRRPGFHLLSLSPSSTQDTGANNRSFADSPCFLPSEHEIYLRRYLPLLFLSLVVLLIDVVRKHRTRRQRSDDAGQDYVGASEGGQILPLSAGPYSDEELNKQAPDPISVLNSGRAAGTSNLAPTLRAATNIGQYTPHTPDFTVGGEIPRELRSSGAPAAFMANISEDTEGDEEDFQTPSQMARYRVGSGKDGEYFRLTLDRAKRKRRLARTWTFELGGRRRRLTIGVPVLLEHIGRTFFTASSTYLLGGRGGPYARGNIFTDFLHSVFIAGRIPLLLFCLIYFIVSLR